MSLPPRLVNSKAIAGDSYLQAQDFHTDADAGNILAFFNEQDGLSGGKQCLSSAWYTYNVLADVHPQALRDLAEDWHWEKPNRQDSAKTNVASRRAIIGQVDGKLELNFGRSFVASNPAYPMSDEAPSLSESQERSLNDFMETARAHGFQLDTRVGDIVYVNNLSIMHARSAFLDEPKDGRHRHILRQWLKDRKSSWSIAASLKYEDGRHWDVPPALQQLSTETEWASVPRPVRLQTVGTVSAHD